MHERDVTKGSSHFCVIRRSLSPSLGFQNGFCYREQLEEIGDALDRVDPGLMQVLTRLDCSECFFAYRMVLVMMRRELTLSEVALCLQLIDDIA